MTYKSIAWATILGTALVLSSTASGIAAAKKKKAEAAPTSTAFCMGGGGQVCGTRGGLKFTYANACYAQRDGAKVSGTGACKAGKAKAKASTKSKSKKKA